MNKSLRFGAVVIGAALGTWTLGWWAVPAVALIAGLAGCEGGLVSAASATAWLILLMADATSGSVPRVAGVLAGVMGLPPMAIFLVTLALPAVLGWSAALLGNAARSIRPTSRRPS
jgi:hypothetical protein